MTKTSEAKSDTIPKAPPSSTNENQGTSENTQFSTGTSTETLPINNSQNLITSNEEIPPPTTKPISTQPIRSKLPKLVTANQYGSLLIPVKMAKLPNEIKLQVARNAADEVWEMSTILEILLKKVDAREVSEMVKASTDNRKPPFSHPPSATAMTTQNGRDDKSIQCVYCK